MDTYSRAQYEEILRTAETQRPTGYERTYLAWFQDVYQEDTNQAEGR